MGRKALYTNLTEEQLKEKRRLYMKLYYLNNKHKEKLDTNIKPKPRIEIKKGIFILYFD